MSPPVPLTPEAWARIRYEYEHTKRSLDDIAREHGISAGTLRDRVRRWGWTPRWGAIPLHGPPAVVVPVSEAVPQPHFPSPLGGEGGEQRSCEPGEGVQTAESPRPPHPNPLPHSPSKTGVNALMGEREQAVHKASAFNSNAPAPHPDPLPASGEGEPSPHLHDTRPIGQRVQDALAQVMPALETTLSSLAAGPMAPRQMEQAARALGSLTRTLRELNGLVAQHGDHQPARSAEEFEQSLARKLESLISEERAAVPERYLAGWQEFAAEAETADALVHKLQ